MNKKILIILVFGIFLFTLISSVTLNQGIILNTNVSNSSIDFSSSFNITNISLESTYVYLYNVSFVNATGFYDCGNINHSEANTVLSSDSFECNLTETEFVDQSAAGYSGYVAKIYFSDGNLSTSGNNFNMWYNDKIKFVVNLTNHTLTMGHFNSSGAKVIIQSNPIKVRLEKGVLYEFDLNNNSANDVSVRYDGLNKTSAMIFLQEIVVKDEVESDDKNIVSEFVEIEMGKNYVGIIVIVFIVLVGLYFVFRKRIKKGFHNWKYSRKRMMRRI